MKIMITGAGGLVGKALTAQLSPAHDVEPLRHSDLDITDADAVMRAVSEKRPELIINCAVLQVDPCELDPERAAAINVSGPRNLALATRDNGGRVLHFSTNYVFDGRETGRAPYTWLDETRPINVYGQTKLDGERAIFEVSPLNTVVRTAWVYGTGKPSFLGDAPTRLRQGLPVNAIIDAFSTTTYVNDLAVRVDEIVTKARPGIYQVVNEGTCSYFDFALEAARFVGLSPAEAERLIVRVRDRDLKRAAPRPHWTPLECKLSMEIGLPPLRNWREALAHYITHDLGE